MGYRDRIGWPMTAREKLERRMEQDQRVAETERKLVEQDKFQGKWSKYVKEREDARKKA